MKTTQDLIKILPFKPEFKEDLLDNYDSLSKDQQYAITRLVWDLYDAIYESQLDANMKKAFERVKKSEEKLDNGFYERVRKLTDQEFEKENSEAATTVDLSSAREELQKIINKIPHQKN